MFQPVSKLVSSFKTKRSESPQSPRTISFSCSDFEDPDSGLVSLSGFPPFQERSVPDGAEEDAPDTNRNSGNDGDDEDDDLENEEEYDSVPPIDRLTSSQVLPWGAPKERARFPSNVNIETDIKPGEFVMRTLFAEFTIQAEKKISAVMVEPLDKPLSKSLQRGEDPQFDQLLSSFGSVAEHCLPSILRILFNWYERQGVEWVITDYKIDKGGSKGKSELSLARSELEFISEKRDLAVEFIFCLVLVEVLKQLSVHPGHEDLVQKIENLCFKHFRYRDTPTLGPNAANIHMIADLYAEVLGVLAQSRFLSTKKKFFAELRELRSREPNTHTTQSIISLLMGLKFFRVKMVPFEDFEHSFQFMHECAQYFLEVKDKDIKHAVAGLFVEILVPVAAAVKNEVNVPCLKNFVEKLYSTTLDMCTRSKHRLAIFPLVTCLLCVSQKAFFLHNWHYFLTMCLQHLKNRDTKMARVALESLYRLLWVYMIRIKCESNNVTQSRLQSIVNSLFPKGSKAVVPRDTPLNIFVKIIQFIAQEKVEFAMREIVFDLLSVGRPIKVINAPERMSIGLRAFLVVADSLEQKEGEPPMPRTVGVMPSGSTLRVKKTFLNKMLTEDTAKSIGLSSYYPYVRKVFDDILRALDSQFGRPFLMTNAQSAAKEADDAKPKLDLFRTVIAAIPRLIPDGMSRGELVDTLSRLTVHNDEELRGLACQGLQNLVIDFPDWREDVLYGFMQFVVKDISDQQTTLLDNALRMLLQLLTAWKNTADRIVAKSLDPTRQEPNRPDMATTLHMAEGFALVMFCHIRTAPRRLAFHILKEVITLFKTLCATRDSSTVLDALDKCTSDVVRECAHIMPLPDKTAALAASSLDFQWLIDRTSSQWTAGFNDDGVAKTGSSQHLFNSDPWSACLIEMLHPDRLPTMCPSAILHSWPTVHTRLTQLFSVVDPAPVTDNRASLLRPGTAPKKILNEKDISMHLWKNYVIFACRVVPPIPSPVMRCVSPDLMLSSSPESLSMITDRSADNKSPSPMVSPTVMYKLLVPLLRCEVPDMRDSIVHAFGKINHTAMMDLMSELVFLIKEAIDRKQENMRRRRRRDTLRLQLVRVLELMAEEKTFSRATLVIENDSGFLEKTFTDYIDGARLYLESEDNLKESVPSIREIKIHFASFIRQLIGSFNLERRRNLLRKDLRRNLFYLFASWSGKFGLPFDQVKSSVSLVTSTTETDSTAITEFEFSSLRAMITVLCCGPCFDEKALMEEGTLYTFLDLLLTSDDPKVYDLAQETIVLILEFNPDNSGLLDWVVDRCFTGKSKVADGCFLSLATIFSAREYPCDHYTAIINVTLMNTGCPRTKIHETALQLLQILDHRFFGSVSPLGSEEGNQEESKAERSTLDVLLSTTYSRSQLYLSRQLAQLHPELTMPMFSEICHRLQTARHSNIKCMLYYLLPWLYNIELVDPNIVSEYSDGASGDKSHHHHHPQTSGPRGGWGTAEATEMVTNNLFYITVKYGDEHPKEVEELWAAICACWPKNLRIIIRYLFIISGLAPNELIDFTKRVLLYLGRSQPVKTLEEMMFELQCVETLNCSIERTETPPFYRLTSLRKASSNSESNVHLTSSRQDLVNTGTEKGTIHTKRHSQEDPTKDKDNKADHHMITSSLKSAGSMASSAGSAMVGAIRGVGEKVRALSGSTSLTKQEVHNILAVPTTDDQIVNQKSSDHHGGAAATHSAVVSTSRDVHGGGGAGGSGTVETNKVSFHNQVGQQQGQQQPHPLPMPEYGGWFAPLTEFLPDASQPIVTFHRCNLAAILITDLVVDGLDLDCHSVDWSVHIPLLLHIVFLGLDNSREMVYRHCQQLLLNLLIVLGQHNDHLGISQILINSRTDTKGFGLALPLLPVLKHNFTEKTPESVHDDSESELQNCARESTSSGAVSEDDDGGVQMKAPPVVVSDSDAEHEHAGNDDISKATIGDLTKALIQFISSQNSQPFWQYECITRTVWSIRSAEQIDVFLGHVLQVFEQSLPHAHLSERWSQLALQLALSCSSRHYAGRSLQIFRALRVPINTRMLSDILSRLVETIAEQGEDMQGYVTELFLTLEAVVDSLDSDFKPMMRDIYQSTPNLKDMAPNSGVGSVTGAGGGGSAASQVSGGPVRKFSPRSGGQAVASAAGHHPGGVVERRAPSPRTLEKVASPGGGHSHHVSAPPMNPLSKNERSYHHPKAASPIPVVEDAIRERSSTESEKALASAVTTLSRSRSAQSLKIQDQVVQDDKMNILVQLFWICLAVLESDFEHEFLLGLRLLEKILDKLPLDRPDVREKLVKLQVQLKWPSFPGVHSLLLKGCTNPNTYEATMQALSRFTTLLDFAVVDPSQSLAFPMNVMALLPYMVQHYEDANELCIRSAENIALVSSEKNKKLENLATVMTLYSRRTFSKESFQWTKCVVKYLYDLYSQFSFNMLGFLVEVLEKGPSSTQAPILTIIHCLLHYVDMASSTQTINGDLLRTVAKFVESQHWKESLKILKLAVNRSSNLVAPPTTGAMSYNWETTSGSNFAEADFYFKKELPGRTMEFTFDLSQTPVIARKQKPSSSSGFNYANTATSSSYAPSSAASSMYGSYSLASTATLTSAMAAAADMSDKESIGRGTITGSTVRDGDSVIAAQVTATMSPRRSLSLAIADSAAFSGWKRPWMCQSSVRERLVTLLNTCGQRVGLPKSPSGDDLNGKVIFSQTSELLERQSSMASSTEEVSGTNDVSTDSKQHDTTDTEQKFGMYMREFDFLEYELESLEGESVDNFNWGVRRPSLSHLEGAVGGHHGHHTRDNSETGGESSSARESLSLTDATPVLTKREANAGVGAEESSDDEMGSQISGRSHEENSGASSSISTTSSGIFPPNSLPLDSLGKHRASTPQSDTDSSDDEEDDDVSDHDLTPCNPSPNMSQLMGWSEGRIADKNEIEEGWRNHVQKVIEEANNETILVTFVAFGKLFDDLKAKTSVITQDSAVELSKEKIAFSPDLVKTTTEQLQNLTDILSEDIPYPHVWYDFENSHQSVRLIERIKFTILEIQENLDNFVDKKDFALECLDAMKAHQKLVSLGEHMADYNMESEPMDLCRCLYKLHFQLLLLLESFGKLLRLISQSHQDLTTDKSRELALIQDELRKAFRIPVEIQEVAKELKELKARAEAEETSEQQGEEGQEQETSGGESRRSPSPGDCFDQTVESGVEDLQRIRIDDDEFAPSDENPADKSSSDESSSTANKSNESDNTLSADSTLSAGDPSDMLAALSDVKGTSETVAVVAEKVAVPVQEADELKPAESEQKIVDLLTESRWPEAVTAYKLHKVRWPGTLPLAGNPGIVGSSSQEDDVSAMLNLFCASLAEKSNIFVMTLSDGDIAESCSRLMDAIQQLSQTIKQLEAYHAKHRRPSPIMAQHGATGTLLPPSKQQNRASSRGHNVVAAAAPPPPPPAPPVTSSSVALTLLQPQTQLQPRPESSTQEQQQEQVQVQVPEPEPEPPTAAPQGTSSTTDTSIL